MTKDDLSQLQALNREIEQIQARIDECEGFAAYTVIQLTGLPKVKATPDMVGKYASEIADLKQLHEAKLQQCFVELHRLDSFIQSIPDSEIRQILSYRYVNGLNWAQVAAHISPYATDESVRKAHDRYLQRMLTPIRPFSKKGRTFPVNRELII